MIVGLLLSLVCLALALRDVQVDVVLATLGRVDLRLLLAAVGVELLTFWVIALRWRRLFPPGDAPPAGQLFRILNIAQLVNAVLPAKLGPLVRAYLAGGGERRRVASALTTIVGEKVLEGLSLLLVAVGLLPFVSLAGWLRPTTWLSAAAFALLLALMVGLAFRPQWIAGRLDRWLARWPHLLDLAQSALAALEVWRSGWTVLALVAWSAFLWAITVVLNQLLLWSLGIAAPLLAPFLLLVVLQLGVRLPSSPGSIGVFHYLSVLTLSLFGVDKNVALGYGVLLHLVTFLPASLLGLFYLGRAGYSLSRLRQAAGRVVSAEESPGGEQP
jgi:uncharacterized protein (TIRG00374 family)